MKENRIVSEFEQWIEEIANFLQKRLKNCGIVETKRNKDNNYIYRIQVFTFNGYQSYIEFHLEEYKKNNKKQRKNLSMVRRKNLALDFENCAEELLKVSRKLKK